MGSFTSSGVRKARRLPLEGWTWFRAAVNIRRVSAHVDRQVTLTGGRVEGRLLTHLLGLMEVSFHTVASVLCRRKYQLAAGKGIGFMF